MPWHSVYKNGSGDEKVKQDNIHKYLKYDETEIYRIKTMKCMLFLNVCDDWSCPANPTELKSSGVIGTIEEITQKRSV